MGLPFKAISFLKENAKTLSQCSACSRHDGYDREAYTYAGMVDDVPLYEYELKGGRTAQEFVQHTVWSSGPILWLGLRIITPNKKKTVKILWPESAFEE
jgi:hypothetical protein